MGGPASMCVRRRCCRLTARETARAFFPCPLGHCTHRAIEFFCCDTILAAEGSLRAVQHNQERLVAPASFSRWHHLWVLGQPVARMPPPRSLCTGDAAQGMACNQQPATGHRHPVTCQTLPALQFGPPLTPPPYLPCRQPLLLPHRAAGEAAAGRRGCIRRIGVTWQGGAPGMGCRLLCRQRGSRRSGPPPAGK